MSDFANRLPGLKARPKEPPQQAEERAGEAERLGKELGFVDRGPAKAPVKEDVKEAVKETVSQPSKEQPAQAPRIAQEAPKGQGTDLTEEQQAALRRKKPGRKPSPRTYQLHPKVLPAVGEAIAAEAEARGITQGQLIEELWGRYLGKKLR